MAYRSCDDCMWNRGTCILGHEDIYVGHYDENHCDDGTGDIVLEPGDYNGGENDE